MSKSRSRSRSRTKKMAPAPAKKGGSGNPACSPLYPSTTPLPLCPCSPLPSTLAMTASSPPLSPSPPPHTHDRELKGGKKPPPHTCTSYSAPPYTPPPHPLYPSSTPLPLSPSPHPTHMTVSQRAGRKLKGEQARKLQPRKLRTRKHRDVILLTRYAMTRKANEANFFVAKYAIARDAT